MFGLKPHKLYGTYMSDSKKILQSKNWFIDIQQYYGDCGTLNINFWKRDWDEVEIFTLRKTFKIYLTFHGLYIRFIYPHLGKYHPSCRSKFYIGKPIESIWKTVEEENN